MRIETAEKRTITAVREKAHVAAYVRVSSQKDAAIDSIENQATYYSELIAANPDWEPAGIYEDRGISGTKELRPAFQRMLADCRAGKIDLILTKSFTRFARNTVVLLDTLRELKALGVDVFFEKENIHSCNESGELLITLLAAFAQAESQSASENQRWRIQKMFEQGKLTGGTRMLGYRLGGDGKLAIVPEEAEIVRQIFMYYLDGYGFESIAKKLNQQNLCTVNGSPWSRNSVHSILTNEKYAGYMILQKFYIQDYISKKKRTNHGERRMFLVENSHEAIIPKEICDAVQAEMKIRAEKAAPKRNQPRNDHLFTGLIRCGLCGKSYRRRIAAAGSKYEKPVWICSTFNTWGRDVCNNQQIPESILIAKTMEVLGTEDLAVAIPEHLDSIRVTGPGQLTYIFKDGTKRDVEWQNPSRRYSWTPEMREQARQHALKRYRKEEN